MIEGATMTCDPAEYSVTLREWFELHKDPLEFYREAKRCNDSLPEHVFFEKRVGGADIHYLFDAFTAGEFARIVAQTASCTVALVNGAFPDFSLSFSDAAKGIVEFEAVEADENDRRRADEYRALHEKRLLHGPDYMELEEYCPYEEEMQAREAIPRVVGQKAAKDYPVTTNLVVRNNLGALEAQEYRDLTKPWQDSFNEIWVLDAPFAIQVWPDLVRLGDPEFWVPNT